MTPAILARRPRRQGAGLSAPLRIREFRAMWAAETLSIAGDQLARVGLSVLVFDRTGSAALTGLTYALTFVPAFLGGALFGGIGDRHPRRTVMVAADVVRAVLVGAAAIPGMPLWLLCVLIAVMTLANGPFKAAQQALLSDVLPDRLYTPGMAVRTVSTQTAQLVGFAGGGALVTVLAPSVGLAIDAGTFAVSAGLLLALVRARPAAAAVRTSLWAMAVGGGRLVCRDPVLRTLIALIWLAAFYVVPEALAAPYAAALGAGHGAVGVIMAADPVGSVIGGIVVGRYVSELTQRKLLGLLGIAAGLPLACCVFGPPLAVAVVLFALSGFFATGYSIQAVATFVRSAPINRRAQVSGLMTAGLLTVQGIGALVAGVVADVLGPAPAIAVAGAAGAAIAVPIALIWRRARSNVDRPPSVCSAVAVVHDGLLSRPQV